MNKLLIKIINYNRPQEPHKKAKWFFRFATPLIGASILEIIITLLSAIGEGSYGAPLPVGESAGFLGWGGTQTFSLLVFLINIFITALLILIVTWWSGIVSGIVMAIGGLTFIIALIALAAANNWMLPPPKGFEILFTLFTFWLYTLFVGFLFAFAWRPIRKAWKK